MIDDNVCVSRAESLDPVHFSNGEYSHSILELGDDGELFFAPLPYRPSQYPIVDMENIEVYYNLALNKTWAACKRGLYTYVFYQNSQTNHRLVMQKVDFKNKSVADAINEKCNKGYKYTGTKTFCSKTLAFK
jgi:hypothetical protein